MRITKTRGLLAALAIIFAVMFAANLAVLRIFFDVRLSDLSLLFYGDIPIEGDGSVERGGSAEEDSPAEEDYFFSILSDPDNLENLIEELSLREKITLVQIMSRIGTDELNKLYEISQDGLTADEIAALREYAFEILDPSDIEALEEILYKSSG